MRPSPQRNVNEAVVLKPSSGPHAQKAIIGAELLAPAPRLSTRLVPIETGLPEPPLRPSPRKAPLEVATYHCRQTDSTKNTIESTWRHQERADQHRLCVVVSPRPWLQNECHGKERGRDRYATSSPNGGGLGP